MMLMEACKKWASPFSSPVAFESLDDNAAHSFITRHPLLVSLLVACHGPYLVVYDLTCTQYRPPTHTFLFPFKPCNTVLVPPLFST